MNSKLRMTGLREWNSERERAIVKPPISGQNGIACPRCGNELTDDNREQLRLSQPPQLVIKCLFCGFSGFRDY